MRERLAVWSWITPVIGLIFYPGMQILASNININCAYRGNLCNTLIGLPSLLLMFVVTITGLIFGITALKRMSQNSKLTGKAHAVIGIILNIIFILYGIFALLGGLFGS